MYPIPKSTLLLLLLPICSHGQVVENCGPLTNAYGPYDYTNYEHRTQKLPIVEVAHFNSDVENLIRGQSGKLIGDIEYTLRAFPNHPRALWSMARLHLREGKKKIDGGRYSIDCWFDRAIRMSPEDPTVRYVYAMYQHKAGELEAARENYELSLSLKSDQAEVHYNLGLLYVDLGDTDKAARHAAEAYRLGYPLPGLRRKLEAKGVDLAAMVDPKSN